MKIVQAFSMWDFSGTFGGAGFTEPEPPAWERENGAFKRLTLAQRMEALDRKVVLSYGVTGGNFWTQAESTWEGKIVRGPAIRYTLEKHKETGNDRERAEKEALNCFHREFAHVEAGALASMTFAAGAMKPPVRADKLGDHEQITHRMCLKCGHPVLLHDDYAGCSAGQTIDGMCRCGCMAGCKPPPHAAPARSLAMQEAVAEGENTRIEQKFAHVQRLGVIKKLVSLGCPQRIADFVGAGIRFTKNQKDAALLGKWVYIAGPMRGKKGQNFPAFDEARNVLLNEGFNVISPVDMDRTDASSPQDEAERIRLYVLRDFWALYLLSEWGTLEEPQFVCFLHGWEESVGASAEALLARWLSLQAIVVDAKLVTPITKVPWGNLLRVFAGFTGV